jgi:hypothetical protein
VSSRTWQRQSAALGLILLLALGLRVGWLVAMGGEPAYDARTYFELATRLAVDGAYHHRGEPTAFWPVGYPAMLAALFSVTGVHVGSAWALNLAVGLGCIASLYGIALRLGLSHKVALLCASLCALNPVYISYTTLVVTESAFLLLLLLAVFVGLRPQMSVGRLLASGALLGCAALVRPVALALPLVLGICGGERRPSVRQAVARVGWLALGLALVVAPWCMRNARALGVLAPVSTNGGMNLYIGNNPYASGRYEFEGPMAAPFADVLPDGYLGGSREVAFDRETRQRAWRHIVAHPFDVVASWPRKLMFTYLPDLAGLTWNRAPDTPLAHGLRPVLPLVIALHELLLLVLSGVGALKLRSVVRASGIEAWSLRVLPLAVVAMFAATSMLYFGMPRFHFPCFPWFELLAAVALCGRAGVLAWTPGARALHPAGSE